MTSNTAKTLAEIRATDHGVLGTGSPIRKATPLLRGCCGKAHILVELENGSQTVIHDDGSFIERTGEML